MPKNSIALSLVCGLLALTLAVLLVCGEGFAQITAVSQISGTVQDSTGSVLPGVQVRAIQTDTGLARAAVSGPDGAYALSNLPVGPYRLEAAKEGFSMYIQSGIVLQVDSNPVINPVLKVGSVAETVEVRANAAMVEARSTGVGQVIDNQRVVELPINGREPLQLILLSGAAVQMGATNINSLRNFPTLSIQIAGGLTGGTTYTLDGGTYNDTINNLNLPLPFPDALQEFKVETSAMLAKTGQHSGGAVDAVTKSGTNQFHGDAFWFIRNGVFDARNFFAPVRDTLKRNQFGGVIGGPIRKNKLFFFTGYQGTDNRSAPVTSTVIVLTSPELAGDFTTLESPACNGGKQGTLKSPFVNNQVSPSLFNSAALKYAGYVPVSTNPCGNYLYGVRTDTTEKQLPAKVDYILSDKQSMWARYTFASNIQPSFYNGTNGLLTSQNALYERAQSFVLGDTYVISPNIVDSFRGSFSRTRDMRTPPSFISPQDAGINISDLAPNPHTDLSVSGFFSLGGSWLGYWNTTNFQFANDVDLIRGPHQISFGVNWIHANLNASNAYYSNGSFAFNNNTTGNALTDFLLGTLDTFNQQAGQQLAVRQNYIGLYIQDSWKISPRLTLNAGLRWEPYLPPRNIRNWVQVFSMTGFENNQHSQVYPNGPAGVTYPGDPGFPGHSLTDQALALFAPRAGLSWDPQGNGRAIIRAAYGIFNDYTHLLNEIGSTDNPPWGSLITLTSPPGGLSNPWTGYPGGNPFPINFKNFQFADYTTYNTTFPRHTPTPYMQQWNLTLQKQLGTEWLASASYLGNKMTHLWMADNINPALYVPGTCGGGPCSTSSNNNQRRLFNALNPSQGPLFGPVDETDAGAYGSYNGLLLTLQRRMSRNISVLGNYTWSHCIDEGEVNTDEENVYRVPFDRRADRANCDSDRHGIFNFSAVANTPVSWPGLLGKVAGNWQLSPLIEAFTGQYFSVSDSSNTALFDGALPVQIANSRVGHPAIAQWFNTSAFVPNLPGQQGNVGRNDIVGPGSVTVNVALSRRLTVREGQRVEIRAEAFNLMNHANFSNPNSTIGNANFGKILSAGDPRILQFALKYIF